jgi:hypothetical protein
MEVKIHFFSRKITFLLVIVLIMMTVSCNSDQSNQSKHPIYQYVFDDLTTTNFHVNDQLKIVWRAKQIPPSNNAISQTKPDRLILEATLSQGFSSPQKIRQMKGAVPSSTSVKIVTDDWTSKTYERLLPLPSTPGYYDLTFSITGYEGNNPVSTSTVRSILTVTKS